MQPKVTRDELDADLGDLRSVIEDVQARVSGLSLEVARPGWLQSVMTRRIVVHRDGAESLEGSLVAEMHDGLVLRAAKMLHDDGKMTPLVGEVWVPRAKVAFAQLQD